MISAARHDEDSNRKLPDKQKEGKNACAQQAPWRSREAFLAVLKLHYGNCCTLVFVGTVLPTFTRIGSRSLEAPVYFTEPSMFASSRR